MTSASQTTTSPTLATSVQQSLSAAVEEALKQLDGAEKEVVLDLSSVRRIDSGDVRQLEEFSHAAQAKNARVSLRVVNVDVYKALKLAGLREFQFVN